MIINRFIKFSGKRTRNRILLFGSLLVLLLFSGLQTAWVNVPDANPYATSRSWIVSEINSIEKELKLSLALRKNVEELRKSYTKARCYYKYIEFFVEYCSPREAKYFINGALVSKHDEEAGAQMLSPQGFQHIEELLFLKEQIDTMALHKEYRLLLHELNSLKEYYNSMELDPGLLPEMCQMQLFRIASLNLNGYDATYTKTNVQESAWCIEGMYKVMKQFGNMVLKNKVAQLHLNNLLTKMSTCIKYLKKHPDYNSFNRLEFVIPMLYFI